MDKEALSEEMKQMAALGLPVSFTASQNAGEALECSTHLPVIALHADCLTRSSICCLLHFNFDEGGDDLEEEDCTHNNTLSHLVGP